MKRQRMLRGGGMRTLLLPSGSAVAADGRAAKQGGIRQLTQTARAKRDAAQPDCKGAKTGLPAGVAVRGNSFSQDPDRDWHAAHASG
jgi:hypothetical protein